MEKVVILETSSYIQDYDLYSYGSGEGVNNYLEDGWTVKSVNTAVREDHVIIIFVLEKKEGHS